MGNPRVRTNYPQCEICHEPLFNGYERKVKAHFNCLAPRFLINPIEPPKMKAPRLMAHYNNSKCQNCGVRLLNEHVGWKYCGDCQEIPANKRDKYYAQCS